MNNLLFYLERIWQRLATGVTVTLSGSSTVSVDNFPASQTVDGTVSVDNFPASFQVSNFPSSQAVTGTVSVSNFPASQTVSGTVAVSNFPASQAVTGAVSVSNFPANQAVSGTVNVGNFPALSSFTEVLPKDTSGATPMDFAHTTPGILPSGIYTLLTYTVPVGKKLDLDFIEITSSLSCKAQIYVDGSEWFVGFGEGNSVPIDYKRKYVFPAGTLIEFVLQNRGSSTTSIYVSMAGDLYDA